MTTVWVLGDQLNRSIGALADARPGRDCILIVEARDKIEGRRWHGQRLHFLLTSMRRFAAELRDEGFDVDYRTAPTMRAGIRDHASERSPERIVATEPNSVGARRLADALGVTTVASNQFLTHHRDFASWAEGRKQLRMEDFYRQQRARLGYLMEGDQPTGGRWNYDADNRQPPPRGGSGPWTPTPVDELDDLDRQVIDSMPTGVWGDRPSGTWATSRSAALARLDHFVEHNLAHFGPHEDAMLAGDWQLAHSVLSPYLNNGLLLPGEVCDAVHDRYLSGGVPIASAEGFLRQVIGWREYIWGLYWLWMPGYAAMNELGATRPVPPAFRGEAPTRMRCLATTLSDLERRGWTHHIQRLMILGNLSISAGVSPQALTEWMWESFVDGAEWVMVPNVIGMSQHADGGRMATKPYLSGGAYVKKMSDYCKGCAFDPGKRTGETACPFTTLYWDFHMRHAERFVRNPRMSAQVRSAEKLADGRAVHNRAADVLQMLDAGRL